MHGCMGISFGRMGRWEDGGMGRWGGGFIGSCIFIKAVVTRSFGFGIFNLVFFPVEL